MTRPSPDVSIPREEMPTATCNYCGQPFKSEHARDLHVRENHAKESTSEERRTSEPAEDVERERLFYLQVKALVLLALLWMTTLFGYMIAGGLQWNT